VKKQISARISLSSSEDYYNNMEDENNRNDDKNRSGHEENDNSKEDRSQYEENTRRSISMILTGYDSTSEESD